MLMFLCFLDGKDSAKEWKMQINLDFYLSHFVADDPWF